MKKKLARSSPIFFCTTPTDHVAGFRLEKMAAPLQRGDRILILKERWLDLILSDEQTMETRSKRLRAGKYYLGYKAVSYTHLTLPTKA